MVNGDNWTTYYSISLYIDLYCNQELRDWMEWRSNLLPRVTLISVLSGNLGFILGEPYIEKLLLIRLLTLCAVVLAEFLSYRTRNKKAIWNKASVFCLGWE